MPGFMFFPLYSFKKTLVTYILLLNDQFYFHLTGSSVDELSKEKLAPFSSLSGDETIQAVIFRRSF